MNRFNIRSIILLAFVLTACCSKPDKKDFPKKDYQIITTFLQVDDKPMFKYMTETQDLAGNILERIRYFDVNEQIYFIQKYYYDSLQRKTLIYTTRFPVNTHPETETYQLLYDTNGLISATISKTTFNTNTVYYDYFPNKKIKQSKTTSTNDVWWDGVTTYVYDKNDSLIKQEDRRINDEEVESRDSIVYTDTSKVIYEFHFANKTSSKIETIHKNNKIIKQIEYEVYTMSKDNEFYIDKETHFTYHKNRLVKKVIKTMPHTAWCGQERPGGVETFTYRYE